MLKRTVVIAAFATTIATTLASFSTSANAANQAAEVKPFTAIYETSYGIMSARGERKLEAGSDGQWKMHSNAQVMNLAISEAATFSLSNGRIKPLDYQFQNPFSKDRSQSLSFDWTKNSVTNAVNNTTLPLAPNVYDKLSYQLQLQLNVCSNPDKYRGEDFTLVDRKRLKTYRVEVMAKEILQTDLGALNTIRLRQFRSGKSDGKDTQIWLATDWQCVLVRLDQNDDDDTHTLKLVSATVGGKNIVGKK